MNQDINMIISVKSFMAEMHNDALYYLQEARKTNDIFQKWRFIRSAIIFFCISVEATLTQLVVEQLKKNVDTLDQNDIKLLNRLTNPEKAEDKLPSEFFSFESKIKVFNRLYKQNINQTIKSQMITLTRFRNKIVHYTSAYEDQIYNQAEQMAFAAPEIIDKFLSEIFKIAGIPADNGFHKFRDPLY